MEPGKYRFKRDTVLYLNVGQTLEDALKICLDQKTVVYEPFNVPVTPEPKISLKPEHVNILKEKAEKAKAEKNKPK